MASEKDIQDVIKTLIAEGVGEGEEGMRRIAETILNRAEQRGISPAQVVRERAQYTGYSNPGPGAVRAFSDPNAITAAQAAWALAQGPDDPTNGANHYWNPNIVTPSWSGGMKPLGQYGNHAFATDRPDWTRVAKVAPNPAAQSPMLASQRANTSPSGGNTALQEAVMRAATAQRNRVTPASVEDRVTARNRVPGSSAFGDDPMTPAAGTVVATIPSKPSSSEAARRAALKMTQSYAGQEKAGPAALTRSAPAPVAATIPSASDLARGKTTTVAPQSTFSASDMARGRAPITAEERLPSSPPGLPALYGTMTPAQVAQVGTPLAETVSPTTGLRTVVPNYTPPPAKVAPIPLQRPAAVAQAPVPVQPVMRAPVRVAIPQAPVMQRAAQPTTIVVRGSNTIIPDGPTAQQRVQFGDWATRNSGDTSTGSQSDAARARASGDGGRIRRY